MTAATTTAEKQNGSAALAGAEQMQLARALPTPLAGAELTTLDTAWRWAKALSDSTLVPKAYRGQPSNVLYALNIAQELGLTPALVMRDVYFINDRPCMYAELKLALVRRSSVCEYIVCLESDEKHCVWEAKRRGSPKPSRLEVRLDQIPKHLREKDTWTQFPANMLRWRGAGWLCDMEFSDVTLGIRTRDEMDDVVVDALPSPLEGKHVPAGVQAVIPSGAAPTAQAEPHDPITGEVEEKPAPAAAAPVVDPVEQLAADIRVAKTVKALEEIRELKVDTITPKGHARRQEIGQLLAARRKELQGA